MRAITLEYHDVLDGSTGAPSGFAGRSADSYKLSLATFEAHLERIASLSRTTVAAASIRHATYPAFLMTFDDGGASALSTIAPALEARNLLGHFFVTTSMIGTRGFCRPSDLRALARRGHVIGTHSHTHPTRMAQLDSSALLDEWRTSVAILRDILGAAPEVASVPGGYYSLRVARAAAQAGIRYLFTSEPVTTVHEKAGCLVLGRFTLRSNSPASEVGSLLRRSGSARTRQWLAWNAKKAAKALVGEQYLKLRARLFRES